MRCRLGRDRMVLSWIYNYLCNRCLSPLKLWVRISIRERCTTLCDEVCHWLATGRWFSPGTPVSSTNKTDGHDITKILLKVALNTITITSNSKMKFVIIYILSLKWIYLLTFVILIYISKWNIRTLIRKFTQVGFPVYKIIKKLFCFTEEQIFIYLPVLHLTV